LQLLTPSNNFVDDPTCTGAISNGRVCVFSNEYLIQQYSFKVGAIVQARVRAHNKNGWGGYSQINTGDAYIQYKPAKMPTPTEGSGTSFDRIQINIHEMVTLEETGGTFNILSYEIQMLAPGQTVWESLVGGGA